MGFSNRVLKIVVPMFFMLAWFGVCAQTPDFNVQHIQENIGNIGATNVNITPVISMNNAFVLPNNNRKTHAGRSDQNASNLEGDDMAGAVQLSSINTLTYFRETGSRSNNMRFSSSVWEYVGPAGGDNEFVVRGRYAISLNGSTNDVTQAITGVLNENDCIPFITGIMNSATADGADSATAIAYLEDASTLRVQKGSNANNVIVYITLVEFTGANWVVSHGDSGDVNGDSGTITIRTNADGSGGTNAVSSWSEAIIFGQFRGDNNNGGINDALSDLWPVLDPGNNNRRVDWTFHGNHDSNGTNRHFVHVLNNSNLNITRFQNSSNATGETTIDISGSLAAGTNEALIVGFSRTSGNGQAYGRGWRNYYFNSANEAAHWSHRSGNTMRHELQIVDLSGLVSLAPEINITGNGASITSGLVTTSTTDDTDFGTVNVAAGSVTHTFTIENLGGADLDLTDPSPYISILGDASEFTLTANPSATIAGYGSTSFDITFNPTSAGTKTAIVSIANNDTSGSEDPYTFRITGFGDGYCGASGVDFLFTTGIINVTLNTINNSDTTKDNGYEDFTTISTDLQIGNSYDLSVRVDTGVFSIFGIPFHDGTAETYAWIDWNQDGDFGDLGESYDLGNVTNSNSSLTPNSPLSISVPLTAQIGTTRMRIITKYQSTPTSCDTGFDGEVEDYSINVICTTNTWTGAVDTDWNNPLNWSCGVPSITNDSDVLIPSGLVNYPIVSSSGAAGEVRNLEIESGAILTVDDNYLEINGTFLLNGTLDLENEGQLLQTNSSDFDSSSVGVLERDQQGTANSFNYNYWSSPVYETTVLGENVYTLANVLKDGRSLTYGDNLVFNGSAYAADSGPATALDPLIVSSYWLFTFNGFTDDYNAWNSISETTNILVGEGFTMKGSTGAVPINNLSNYVFQGKPNNGDIRIPVSVGHNRLIGNPYPSAIDANEFIKDQIKENINGVQGGSLINIFNGALYFWDHFGEVNSHNLRDYVGGYATYTLIGGVGALATDVRINTTSGIFSSKIPTRYIPVAQGFFVSADDDSVSGVTSETPVGGNLIFKNSQRIFVTEASGNSVFLKQGKNTPKATSNIENKGILRVLFSSSYGYHRQLLLGVDESTTKAFDIGYDGALADEAADDMFWLIEGDKYVIQGVPNVNLDSKIPIGIILASNGIVKLKIEELENLNNISEVYIEDQLTGENYLLNNGEFEIELEAGEYLNRFNIAFQPNEVLSTQNEILENEMIVFMDNQNSLLKIRNNSSSEIINIQLFNSLGQTVNSWQSDLHKNYIELPIFNKSSGVYFVKVNTVNGTRFKKVLLK